MFKLKYVFGHVISINWLWFYSLQNYFLSNGPCNFQNKSKPSRETQSFVPNSNLHHKPKHSSQQTKSMWEHEVLCKMQIRTNQLKIDRDLQIEATHEWESVKHWERDDAIEEKPIVCARTYALHLRSRFAALPCLVDLLSPPLFFLLPSSITFLPFLLCCNFHGLHFFTNLIFYQFCVVCCTEDGIWWVNLDLCQKKWVNLDLLSILISILTIIF